MTPHTPTAAADLREVLREVRRSGLSISDQDVTLGIAAVGAPIFGFDGQVRAALSTSGIREAILGDAIAGRATDRRGRRGDFTSTRIHTTPQGADP